ncbi:MAG: DUF6152 family protein [Pseudomonadota bacterium]|nr:DUF6152 family protein [Pseudomonadota bacterium]
MRNSIPTVFAAMTLSAFASSAMAHHSFSMFDGSKTTVLEGTLKSVQLTNPHSYFTLTATGSDGVAKDWQIEGPSPNNLIRRGWKHTDLNAGDQVTVTFHPRKDGAAGGVVMSVRLPDGRLLQSGAGTKGAPAAERAGPGGGAAPPNGPPNGPPPR